MMLLCLLIVVQGIFREQAGQRDSLLQHLGRPVTGAAVGAGHLLGSDLGILALVDDELQLQWRQQLPQDEHLVSVHALGTSRDPYGLSVSSLGQSSIWRRWSVTTGLLDWETRHESVNEGTVKVHEYVGEKGSSIVTLSDQLCVLETSSGSVVFSTQLTEGFDTAQIECCKEECLVYTYALGSNQVQQYRIAMDTRQHTVSSHAVSRSKDAVFLEQGLFSLTFNTIASLPQLHEEAALIVPKQHTIKRILNTTGIVITQKATEQFVCVVASLCFPFSDEPSSITHVCSSITSKMEHICLAFDDDSYHMYRHQGKQTSDQSLAYVLDSQFVDTHSRVFESQLAFPGFYQRLQRQVNALFQAWAKPVSLSLPVLDAAKYAINKPVVFLTRSGMVIALDALQGSRLWAKEACPPHDTLALPRMAVSARWFEKEIVIFCANHRVSFNAPTGARTVDPRQDHNPLQSLYVIEPYTTPRIILETMDSTLVPVSGGSIQGFRFLSMRTTSLSGIQHGSNGETERVWRIATPNRISHTERDHDLPLLHVDTMLRKRNDRFAIKYLNPNLAAFALQEGPSVTVHVYDMFTGYILASRLHRSARGPSPLAILENKVVYTLWNTEVQQAQMHVLELDATASLSTQSLKTRHVSSSFSSMNQKMQSGYPILTEQVYTLPTTVVALSVSKTQQGITSKELLLALDDGKLMTLAHSFVSAHRPAPPHAGAKPVPGQEPWYDAAAFLPLTNTLNYDQHILQLRRVQSTYTDLESASLLLAVGVDVFLVQSTPSGSFDLLEDHFNVALLFSTVAAVCIGTAIAYRAATRKQLLLQWS